MVGKPMQADGPPVYEDDPPVTLGEIIATSDDDYRLQGALAMSRCWPEGVKWAQLDPWQRIGPELLEMLYRRDMTRRGRVHSECLHHVIPIFRKKRLSVGQYDRAVSDGIDRFAYGECMPAEFSALAAACRKETFLDIRSEAVAFLVSCAHVAEYSLRRALGMGTDRG